MTKKIIIADDYQEARLFLVETVKEYDRSIEIDEVDNGERLVEKVKNNNYVLVFTDNDMGAGIYGVEAIRKMREFNRSIPIYMISADSWAREEAVLNGANGFILKNPIKEQILEILLRYF